MNAHLVLPAKHSYDAFKLTPAHHQPPWRNWLARSAVNRKVGGSSPPGGAILLTLRASTTKLCLYFGACLWSCSYFMILFDGTSKQQKITISSFRSVVVITCASHAQGRRFEPGRKQSCLFGGIHSRVTHYTNSTVCTKSRDI